MLLNPSDLAGRGIQDKSLTAPFQLVPDQGIGTEPFDVLFDALLDAVSVSFSVLFSWQLQVIPIQFTKE